MNKGKIVQIIGPVVDIEFADQLPAIYNAVTVDFTVQNQTVKLTLEVQQHLGEGWVRAVAELFRASRRTSAMFVGGTTGQPVLEPHPVEHVKQVVVELPPGIVADAQAAKIPS